jgi:hypothetical protein
MSTDEPAADSDATEAAVVDISVRVVLRATLRAARGSFSALALLGLATAAAGAPHLVLQRLFDLEAFAGAHHVAYAAYLGLSSLVIYLPIHAAALAAAMLVLRNRRVNTGTPAGFRADLAKTLARLDAVMVTMLPPFAMKIIRSNLASLTTPEEGWTALNVFLGIVSLGLIVLAIYLTLRFFVAPVVAAVEGADGLAALARSSRMTCGRRGSICGATFALSAIVAAFGLLLWVLKEMMSDGSAVFDWGFGAAWMAIVVPLYWTLAYAVYEEIGNSERAVPADGSEATPNMGGMM